MKERRGELVGLEQRRNIVVPQAVRPVIVAGKEKAHAVVDVLIDEWRGNVLRVEITSRNVGDPATKGPPGQQRNLCGKKPGDRGFCRWPDERILVARKWARQEAEPPGQATREWEQLMATRRATRRDGLERKMQNVPRITGRSI